MVCNVRNTNFDNSISLEADGQKKDLSYNFGAFICINTFFFSLSHKFRNYF